MLKEEVQQIEAMIQNAVEAAKKEMRDEFKVALKSLEAKKELKKAEK